MNKKVLWFVIPSLALIVGAVLVVRLGLVPVNADASPSSLETRIFPMVLRASVAREARQIRPSRPLSDESLAAGHEIYDTLCAQCHGRLDGKAGSLGMSLYPPAPQFPGHPASYSDPELFWLIKHGIRNTGMPAWGNRLADRDIWDLVAFLRSFPNQDPPH
jgi:mono/diheme cytochrome c family protein